MLAGAALAVALDEGTGAEVLQAGARACQRLPAAFAARSRVLQILTI